MLSPREPILICATTRTFGVRCRSGRLQVVTLWQVIGQYAPHVRRCRAMANSSAIYEEMRVIFTSVPDDVLVAMANRLAALPWVLDVWFCP
ncbi:hypothetical protein SAMN05192539_1010117 [Paraburkholderia diazotrophica]|uniref:Uncharacterized protein n=1 Tax=Paraburkholderia diazotrophica TaxID=667676 RepID=A0A1H6YTP0_9BURK|nr:hypothetical protein SAMN05192539_1010117 [Paraburkholderia diazotrophica]